MDLVVLAGQLQNHHRLYDELVAAYPILKTHGFAVEKRSDGVVQVRVYYGNSGPPVTSAQVQAVIATHDDSPLVVPPAAHPLDTLVTEIDAASTLAAAKAAIKKWAQAQRAMGWR